jgi:hypothetical protein
MRSVRYKPDRNTSATVINWTPRRALPQDAKVKVFCISVDSDSYEIGLGGGAGKAGAVYAALGHGFLQ